MAAPRLPARADPSTLRGILDLPVVQDFIATLDEKFRRGRPGYANRARIGMIVAKHLYEIEDWTNCAAIVPQMPQVMAALGCETEADVPSAWACYRFNRKLRKHPEIAQAFDAAITAALIEADSRLVEFGALDASDVEARANCQKYEYDGGPERRQTDPNATWGHRSAKSTTPAGSFGGYKLHMLVSAHPDPDVPEIILAHDTHPAGVNEQTAAPAIIDRAAERGALPTILVMDKQYDGQPIAGRCERHRTIAIVPRIAQKLPGQTRKAEPDYRPQCEHGTWMCAGPDYRRRATKWRCPTGECAPKSTWLPASRKHPLIPYKGRRWKRLFKLRPAVERVYSRLKEHHLLKEPRVRGRDRFAQHCTYAVWTHNLLALYRLQQRT